MDGAEWLGRHRAVRLDAGTIRYREAGSGPPIVFVHGLLVNGALWRRVVPLLAGRFRCIVPDLPLGGHRPAMPPDADLTPAGLARLVADFLAALDLQDVTLVGSDTGGAICQLVVAHHPERVGRLVLTNCDAYEHFPPPLVLPFKWGAFVPGFVAALAHALRLAPARHLLYGLLARHRPEPAVFDDFFAPLIDDPAVRRDVTKVLRGVTDRATLEAATAFPRFRKPVLIVWGKDDIVFPLRDAERLQRDFPVARLERIADSRCFVCEDQPKRLAALIGDFLNKRRVAAA
jgi:pimeloyl-ACP methyl ester carboxylesterase